MFLLRRRSTGSALNAMPAQSSGGCSTQVDSSMVLGALLTFLMAGMVRRRVRA